MCPPPSRLQLLLNSSALLILFLFFLFINEVGDRFCTFETRNSGNAFGD